MVMTSSKKQEGFTLVEVMIALAVLSFGIMGMMVMQGAGIKGNASANTITKASVLAGDRIEQIFEMDYDDLEDVDGNGVAGLNATAGADGSDLVTNAPYNIYWNVVEDYPMDLTKTVRVIVTRLERGTTKTVTYNYIKHSW